MQTQNIKTPNQEKLLTILSEIFQLNQSDLDFGMYRIMNSKSQEIHDFLDNDLLSSVANAFSSNDNNSIQTELDNKIKSFRDDGFTEEQIDNNIKVIALREQLSTTSSSSNLENDVFSHLITFFKRYYKDGDFVSLRRYKKDTYAIPYEGEEVKLHWANSDQYYIKSGEYFRDYSFKAKTDYAKDTEKTIHFKLSDAQTQSNNNKATSDSERKFIILEDNPCAIIDGELYIHFEYKAIGKEKQDKLNEEAIVKALENIENSDFVNALNALAPTQKNKKRTIFEKHLKSYTSRNSFDYFIHKDLGGFLSRELDFYIKNEILFLDDILLCPIKYEEVMAKIKIFKKVSQKIISFLTQLENLQKKLWEKKKFVIETNYCLTLDKIDENYYDEIFACKEQKTEWKELFDVDIQSIDDLKEEQFLVLDTKFFDMKFKYKLLSEFDSLDEEIDGVLINSENFGALNLLQERYKEQVKTVYIDPPYNTGNDGFLYNDSYQHSSWLSFMYDRLSYAKELMSKEGVIFSSIDDLEITNLRKLNDVVFGNNNFVSELIWRKKTGASDAKGFATITEYIPVYIKSKDFIDSSFTQNKQSFDPKRYKHTDEYVERRGTHYVDNLDRGGIQYSDSMNYAIECPDGSFTYPNGRTEFINDGWIWTWGKDKLQWGLDNGFIILKKSKSKASGWGVYYKNYMYVNNKDEVIERSAPHKNFISDIINTEATSEIKKLYNYKAFQYTKPSNLIKLLMTFIDNNHTILDYFAGSGTTGHAVINLNREDNGKRKYILVEMGEYFDSVTKPRIQKVIYSDSWKDGKPTTKNGVSQIFKYFKLESYEDTLNNLEFTKTKEQEDTLALYPSAKDDYMLNYSLDVESQGSLLNIDTFSTPFNYTLKIATSSVGETKDTAIDLVETFNYLLGLVVKRIEMLKGYLIVEGQNLGGEKILIIWRDGQSSDALNEFFMKMDWSVYDREFDTIFVNGDNNLPILKTNKDTFKVKLIEQEFKRLMFGE